MSDLIKALRTHHRDDLNSMRHTCLNILTENVLTQMKLALSAINRPAPKIEVGAHQIELSIGAVEQAIAKLNQLSPARPEEE